MQEKRIKDSDRLPGLRGAKLLFIQRGADLQRVVYIYRNFPKNF